jgi:urocanate hydratase
MQIANASDRQLETLRLYGRLVDEHEDWGGGLVLCCGEGCAESGAPTAVSIAGGATLVLDADAGAVKSAMRRGDLDFAVNTLDEALRALKNEVRLRRPLSVGLIADVDAVLREMVERGVLPDLLLIGANQNAQAVLQNESIRALQAIGMPLRLATDRPEVELSSSPRMILSSKPLDEFYLPATNAAELRALDERVLAILPADDLVRRRWTQRVPKYLREARSDGRWVWLTEEELKRLREAGIQD